MGILRSGSAPATPGTLHKVLVGTLHELGWVEGRNIVYDLAYADGDEKRLPEVAAALVARRPDVIYAANSPLAQAAFGATRTILIVFATLPDPVGAGLVKSLARPGGNATGVALFAGELGTKRMQLVKEVLPRLSRVGVLVNPMLRTSSEEQKLIEQAAGAAVRVFPAVVKAPAELHGALAALAEHKPEALLVTQSALFLTGRRVILEHAGKYRIPVVGHFGEMVDDGALRSYNSSLADHHRLAAHVVDKVLRGTKPGDIPVQQPMRFELAVNLKTAKALGLTIPQSVLVRVDRVIE